MMRQSNDQNPVLVWAIDDREWKIPQKHPPGVLGDFLNGRQKALTKPRFLGVVVRNFSQQLEFGRLKKARPSHDNSLRASANTSSAEKERISPRSKIGRAHV